MAKVETYYCSGYTYTEEYYPGSARTIREIAEHILL